MTDRVLQGTGVRGAIGTILNESLPNITGFIGGMSNRFFFDGDVATNGSFHVLEENKNEAGKIQQLGESYAGGRTYFRAGFDASRSSSTYQDNAPVQTNALCIVYAVKY